MVLKRVMLLLTASINFVPIGIAWIDLGAGVDDASDAAAGNRAVFGACLIVVCRLRFMVLSRFLSFRGLLLRAVALYLSRLAVSLERFDAAASDFHF